MRMFGIGFINNAGLGVMIIYTMNLSAEFNRNLQYAMFVVFVQAVPIVARIFNSLFFIQISHESRLIFTCILFILSYTSIALSIRSSNREDVALPCAIVGCILHQLGRSIGEATILGYLKALPQELICSFGTGSGVSTFFYIFIALIL